ncbi:hypothetical protein NL352_28965, partial [Klebsiella pneumoniae]|nr:hypothetical protein [Klebsiella pneumoniae]
GAVYSRHGDKESFHHKQGGDAMFQALARRKDRIDRGNSVLRTLRICDPMKGGRPASINKAGSS